MNLQFESFFILYERDSCLVGSDSVSRECLVRYLGVGANASVLEDISARGKVSSGCPAGAGGIVSGFREERKGNKRVRQVDKRILHFLISFFIAGGYPLFFHSSISRFLLIPRDALYTYGFHSYKW